MDEVAFKDVAQRLYEHGVALSADDQDLVARIESLIQERTTVLLGQPSRSLAPAVQMAYRELHTSDVALRTAIGDILHGQDNVIAAFGKLEASIKHGMDDVQAVLARIHITNRLTADLRDSVRAVITRAELDACLHTFDIGALLVMQHLLLVTLYDANARYLDRPQYVRSKALHSGLAILEAAAEDTAHAAIAITVAGVTTMHVVPIAVVLALFKVCIVMTKSRMGEASKRLDAAKREFEKLYFLQELQDEITRFARTVVESARSTVVSAQAAEAKLDEAVFNMKIAQIDSGA